MSRPPARAAHALRCICVLLVDTHVQVQVMIISIVYIRNSDECEAELTTKNVMQIANRWMCRVIILK